MKLNLKLNRNTIKSNKQLSGYLMHAIAFVSFSIPLIGEIFNSNFGIEDFIYILGLVVTVSSFFNWRMLNKAFSLIEKLKEINSSLETSLMANAKFTEKLLLILKKLDKAKLLNLGILLEVKENKTVN